MQVLGKVLVAGDDGEMQLLTREQQNQQRMIPLIGEVKKKVGFGQLGLD